MINEPIWAIQATDFADDDSGTLYTLFDETGVPVLCAAWPQPLQAIAAIHGYAVTRLPSFTEVTYDKREWER
jgi:hypothetical protein